MSQLFLLPQEMCLHHSGGFLLYTVYIYSNVYSIAQHLTIFMVFCHKNKVWYWELFDPQELASYPLAYPKAGTR